MRVRVCLHQAPVRIHGLGRWRAWTHTLLSEVVPSAFGTWTMVGSNALTKVAGTRQHGSYLKYCERGETTASADTMDGEVHAAGSAKLHRNVADVAVVQQRASAPCQLLYLHALEILEHFTILVPHPDSTLAITENHHEPGAADCDQCLLVWPDSDPIFRRHTVAAGID